MRIKRGWTNDVPALHECAVMERISNGPQLHTLTAGETSTFEFAQVGVKLVMAFEKTSCIWCEYESVYLHYIVHNVHDVADPMMCTSSIAFNVIYIQTKPRSLSKISL